jgi:hypothetical protein
MRRGLRPDGIAAAAVRVFDAGDQLYREEVELVASAAPRSPG